MDSVGEEITEPYTTLSFHDSDGEEITEPYSNLSYHDEEAISSSDEDINSCDGDTTSNDEGMISNDSEMMISNTIERKTRELKNDKRLAVYQFLLKEMQNGKVKRGSIPKATRIFKISISTVELSSRKPTRVGRKRIEIDRNMVLEIPYCRRTNIRTFVEAAEMEKSTLHRRIK
ncbi:hypothetical protein MKW98_003390 [Papaver atlanticum]|uniref:Uncharacterized protein n=1 Tax=Papaver atlanticum TaxID=357466 RepID=A0AAD4XUR8_9MAGN|nr:hypothetical protein MKW98_003390 [Papaver atlanticum]